MATSRPLINYLPLFMQEYIEMDKIMTAEQTEMNSLDTAILGVWNDQYIESSSETAIARLEAMFDITPKGTDTLAERKFRILAKMNQELPYTMNKLKEVLTNLCGATGFSIVLTENTYTILIKLALTNVNNYSEVQSILAKMLPANMVQSIQIMYNTHSVLSAYTHGYLGSYTHYQLTNEVIE